MQAKVSCCLFLAEHHLVGATEHLIDTSSGHRVTWERLYSELRPNVTSVRLRSTSKEV